MSTAVALVISDLHLSLLRPACRADDDWLGIQEGYLKQVTDLAMELEIPVICAGDIFDRWNPSAELIRFALRHLPGDMLSIPGQHDLPYHQMEGIHRSGYGVLEEAGKIVSLAPDRLVFLTQRFDCFGFGWEEKIVRYRNHSHESALPVAVIHRYCWIGNKKYPGAPETSNATTIALELKGYKVAFFGDNHIPWHIKVGTTEIINCGTFIRRKSDEIKLEPSMWLLMEDGIVKRMKLDTSADKFQDQPEERPETPFNMHDFINQLEKLGEHGLDFRAAIKQHLETEDVEPKTKEIILKALG